MTIGLFGGAFDPPHNGHLAIIGAAIPHFSLDELLVVPTGEAPHKDVATPALTRFALAEAAFGDLRRVVLTDVELRRAGASYTVDTLRWARERGSDLVLLMGGDEYASFETWREPDEILRLARVAVAARPGITAAAAGGRVSFFGIEPWPISSAQLRARVAAGGRIDRYVPARVAELIDELGLYRAVTGLR